MKIVAKLINFEKMQPSKTTKNRIKILITQNLTIYNMKTSCFVRVYNRYRVFCERPL